MSGKKAEAQTIGIVVTHGKLAEELLHTAELIFGDIRDCYAISGSDHCDEDIITKIKTIIGDIGRQNVLLFVDYFGGSCCYNSVRAVQGVKGVKVISGVNLPLILDFLTKRGSMSFQEMVDHLIRRGRESVKIIDL